MKILIALDESIHSQRALEFAIRMRWPGGSRFLAVTVVPAAPATWVGPYDAVPVPPEMLETPREPYLRLVADAEQTLHEAGCSAEGKCLDGDAKSVLVELAAAERIDLVVMGSHGRTGMAKLMLGSVSSHVVTHAPCSVLVVKNGRAAPVVPPVERPAEPEGDAPEATS